VLLFGGGFLNQYLLQNAAPKSNLSVFYMYLFFALFASAIITAVEFLYRQMPDKIGYLFLIGTFIKLGFFTMIFLGKGLLDKQLLMAEKLSIITPLFVYIVLEVVAIYGKLNLDLTPKEKK
jgi:hypothetical protein